MGHDGQIFVQFTTLNTLVTALKNEQNTEFVLDVRHFCTINFIFEESWRIKFCITTQKKMREIIF